MEKRDNGEIEFNVDLVADGRNKEKLICPRCPSIILTAGTAIYKEIEHPLPMMTLQKKREDNEVQMESFRHYWEIEDKFSFENIGFSNTVSGIKYLTCADCEIGPLGTVLTKNKTKNEHQNWYERLRSDEIEKKQK